MGWRLPPPSPFPPELLVPSVWNMGRCRDSKGWKFSEGAYVGQCCVKIQEAHEDAKHIDNSGQSQPPRSHVTNIHSIVQKKLSFSSLLRSGLAIVPWCAHSAIVWLCGYGMRRVWQPSSRQKRWVAIVSAMFFFFLFFLFFFFSFLKTTRKERRQFLAGLSAIKPGD